MSSAIEVLRNLMHREGYDAVDFSIEETDALQKALLALEQKEKVLKILNEEISYWQEIKDKSNKTGEEEKELLDEAKAIDYRIKTLMFSIPNKKRSKGVN